jgi:hypothetical protein
MRRPLQKQLLTFGQLKLDVAFCFSICALAVDCEESCEQECCRLSESSPGCLENKPLFSILSLAFPAAGDVSIATDF